MGIKQLMKMIGDNAPDAVKEIKIEALFGRKVAVDASMSIYQFLIAMQHSDGTVMLTNKEGETTSHIQGLMNRTVRLAECGIKPVYVFDGKAPDLKRATLDDRKEKREASEAALAAAKEAGDQENMEKFSKRTVRVTKEMTEDAKTLIKLMGFPIIEAPTEAEAQCAVMAKNGLVHAVISEDMDTLTFGAPVFIRNAFQPESRKMPINEISLEKVLAGLDVTMPQFIDLCILMGCDYCGTIKGVGPKTALEKIQKHKDMAGVIRSIDQSKSALPDPFNHEEIHAFFDKPEVLSSEQIEEQKLLEWAAPDEEGLKKFLIEKMQFNETRIANVIDKLKKARGTSTQGRLDSFFKKLPTEAGAGAKRPLGKDAKGKDAKKAKGGASVPAWKKKK
uniref:Flap endonuclease 1 n=1 Tax=Hemiselmis andersenii TaxID=464988 RepID=A0A6U4MAU8_HEMAN|mmetsp:Transcript_4567/g.10475  ORF Transcript_4567/g.10475 Transcript_4567/m.10475 type:complete len:391 (-) Transcript_4567:41-1213(-)|eukprot:CAMPEP_0114127422 /NCGR_PEP_ID=MMETSP0043_2-20121206/10369_1 /TAXON_ID=464988 /ORGANISM="Hemiselmis andersenii, Strain CCMP644" /LENGTH=390 /DNA_ID=CAMNT_0001220501 /DNA_START=174 /DNA_END=1346 /DNA_ORIENTATION=-